jgi:hypothetical protein
LTAVDVTPAKTFGFACDIRLALSTGMSQHSRPVLPWILFVLTLLGGIGALLLEKQKTAAADGRIAAAQHAEEKARAELTDLAAANSQLDGRVLMLQNQVGELKAKVAARSLLKQESAHKKISKKARRKHGKHHR